MIKSILRFMILIALTAPVGAFSQPKVLLVGDSKFDFGDIPSFIPAKKIFTIKNIGTQTLILTDVGASCGCTATLLSNDHIAPNDSGTLSITFDAKRFEGQRVQKAVAMRTNDTTKPRIEITFTANVIKILELEPEYLFFRSTVDSAVSQTLTLKNVSPQKITILSLSENSNLASAKLSDEVIKPGEYVTLTATFKSHSAGIFNGNFEIKTDHPSIPQLTIRFFSWVK